MQLENSLHLCHRWQVILVGNMPLQQEQRQHQVHLSFAHTLGLGRHALHSVMSFMGLRPSARGSASEARGHVLNQVSVLLLLWKHVPVGVEDRRADNFGYVLQGYAV